MKKTQITKFAAVVCSTALILGIGSVSAYAAFQYLKPNHVAEKMNDKKLMDAFSGEDAVAVNETQSCGGYDVTLLGIVSGKNISEYLTTAGGQIHDDRTYSVVAIKKSDGTSMPDTSDDAYGDTSFLASPLIQGYDPVWYNAFVFSGGYSDTVENGILYRISECDNVEMFADRDLYFCVLDDTFYDREAYDYDESTGAISRNENYDGLNALFRLPIDASKADPAAAEAYIKSLYEEDEAEGDADAEQSEADIAVEQFMEKLTPDNIEEYAVRMESTVMTVTPDAEGAVAYEYETDDRGSGSGTGYMEYLFPDQKAGMSDQFSYAYSEGGLDDLVIQTFTLNEDKTVTFAVYIPRQQ